MQKLSKLHNYQGLTAVIFSISLLFLGFSSFAQENSKDWCKQSQREQIPPPSIYISEVTQVGTSLNSKYRIKGSLEGVCLNEAAVFENGKRIRKLRTALDKELKRFDFMTVADSKNEPEIRVYTIHGDRAVAQVKRKNNSPNVNLQNVDIVITRPYIPIIEQSVTPNVSNSTNIEVNIK